MNKNNFKEGFTLIELLVVVLIIGILSAIALPQYKKAVEKTKYAEAELLLKNIAEADRSYFMLNGQHASTFDELDIEFADVSAGSSVLMTKNYDFSLIGRFHLNEMIKASRKKGSDYIYEIYRDVNTDKLYCKDLDTSDNITCDMFFGYTCWDMSKSSNGSESGCKTNGCHGEMIPPTYPGGPSICIH